MNLDFNNIHIAFIGRITDAVFKRLQEKAVLAPNLTPALEHEQFQANFFAMCRLLNVQAPLAIPAWRLFAPYATTDDAAFFLHPFASERAFPPTKKLFGQIREAALECCDVRVGADGAITSVALDANPFAVIHNDGRALAIKPVSEDREIKALSFVSAGAISPFTLDIKDTGTLTAFFKKTRSQAGDRLVRLMQQPPYFPAQG